MVVYSIPQLLRVIMGILEGRKIKIVAHISLKIHYPTLLGKFKVLSFPLSIQSVSPITESTILAQLCSDKFSITLFSLLVSCCNEVIKVRLEIGGISLLINFDFIIINDLLMPLMLLFS
mmetsp:Transcript_37118/g.42351  ORF Transcript_37118/g.42351 Transcript_37118/m.42351 type:complete len:119 (-) Transcript_37118:127-483(-)